MNWSDMAGTVGKFAPMLGGLLGGPPGAAAGALIASALGVENTPAAVSQAISDNPDIALKLAQIESDERVKLQQMVADLEKSQTASTVEAAVSVNATMRAESGSEHWPAYSWRPFIGFAFGVNMLIAGLTTSAVYIAVMFGSTTAAAALSTLPAMIGALGAVNGAALPVLGIASWFRGKKQASDAAKANSNS